MAVASLDDRTGSQRGDGQTGREALSDQVLIQSSEVGQVLHLAMQSAGKRTLQHRGFVDLAKGLPDRRVGVLTVDSKRFNVPEHTRAAA